MQCSQSRTVILRCFVGCYWTSKRWEFTLGTDDRHHMLVWDCSELKTSTQIERDREGTSSIKPWDPADSQPPPQQPQQIKPTWNRPQKVITLNVPYSIVFYCYYLSLNEVSCWLYFLTQHNIHRARGHGDATPLRQLWHIGLSGLPSGDCNDRARELS